MPQGAGGFYPAALAPVLLGPCPLPGELLPRFGLVHCLCSALLPLSGMSLCPLSPSCSQEGDGTLLTHPTSISAVEVRG